MKSSLAAVKNTAFHGWPRPTDNKKKACDETDAGSHSTIQVGHGAEFQEGVRTMAPDETNKLERGISIRHMIFIALGGSIGAGLFVGSGGALNAGGPLSLVLNFALVGLGVTCTMGSLGELAAAFPVAGSFYSYSTRFVSQPWGFSMGWNFVFNWLIIFPFELTCIASQAKFWSDVHPAVVITPVLIGLIAISFKGSRWYGEIEHAFGLGKALSLVVFILVALCIIFGGVPSDPRHGTGAMYWESGQLIKNGFSGFMVVFRTAGMSYGGTELLGMTAAECDNPRRALPLATKITFARIIVFYIITLLLLGLCISADDPSLASIGHGAKVSPFTQAVKVANINGLPTFFNVLIVLALVSMANASIFASSRALQALCEHRMGPSWGAKVRNGVPVNAFALSFVAGLLAYVNLAPGGEALFDWLLSLSGACNYYTWMSICASHIGFRRGWHAQGRQVSELLWVSPFGVWGSWLGIAICCVALLANVLTAIFPIGGRHDAIAIVRDNIGTLIPWIVYGGYSLWSRYRQPQLSRSFLIPPAEMDVTTGIRLKQDEKSDEENGQMEPRQISQS